MPDFHQDQWMEINAIFTFVVPVLVGLGAVKYQGKHHSPFDTHPITSFLSIFSLLLYYSLSLPLVAQLPAFHTISGAFTFYFLKILSFSLSIIFLTSLLFQGLFFFLLYLPLLMVFAAHFCGFLRKLLRLRRGTA
ncbi:hypothetical protein BT93_L2772 [Corymbia citriodora subsp. variegata]|uniref:Transmembrane protein n=1 Tax=Corymbia citriodora subsp. variegata TaxID=360336 RepID=A0A8T0CIX3_CORYI|nr:hypothetical protein BT93_L2772 [Corymbia citriodora subsp. variegata]